MSEGFMKCLFIYRTGGLSLMLDSWKLRASERRWLVMRVMDISGGKIAQNHHSRSVPPFHSLPRGASSALFSPKLSPATAFLGDAYVHRHPHTSIAVIFGFRRRAEWLISAKMADPWSFNSHHHPLQHEPVKVGSTHVLIHSGHKRESWVHIFRILQ